MRTLSLLAILLVDALSQVPPPPQIIWASEPTHPGETLLLHGGPFDPSCFLTVVPSPANGVSPVNVSYAKAQQDLSSIKFTLPSTLPVGALSITLVCAGGSSAPTLINAASVWWFQGDIGDTATSGGWVRVFGPTLSLQPPQSTEAGLLHAIQRTRDAMTAPGLNTDAAWEDGSTLSSLASQLLALRAQLNATRQGVTAAPPLTLRLTPTPATSGEAAAAAAASSMPLFLTAAPDSASVHSAKFPIPPGFPLGEYSLAVSNGYGEDGGFSSSPPGLGTFIPLTFFESALTPKRTTIPIISPRAWPPGVFTVDTPTDPCSPAPCPTSDASLAAALSAAGAVGGGRVYFPPGAYFLTQPVVLPPNTLLVGSATKEVAIWFQEWNLTSAPKAPLFALNDSAATAPGVTPALGYIRPGGGSGYPTGLGAASWGLANVTLFLTAFHNEVVVVSNASNGFLLEGVRVRDNPYAFTWGPGVGGASRGRSANWTASQVGQMVDIHGTNNRITGCDLWGVNQLLNSFAPDGSGGKNMWPGWRRGHAYSHIHDNVLWNGLSSHFMQLWRQVIFERNSITGATETAGGQSVGTGPMGGVAQHIFHADNVIRFTWGGDREVMTYDDAGGSYYGALAEVGGSGGGAGAAATVTLAHDAWPASDWEMGGWAGGQMLVINGTGAHQIRRIVTPGVNITPCDTNRTWVLDAPFDIPPTTINASDPLASPPPSFVQIMPFRGRNIFFRDLYVESGPHQYYGHSVQNLVTQCTFESVRGLMAWGQWRGWNPPPPMNSSLWKRWGEEEEEGGQKDRKGGGLKGLMGNGYQPNLQNLYRSLEFTERHHLTNYACGEQGYVEQWGWKQVVSYPSSVIGNFTNTPHPLNVGAVYRGMVLPGGFWLGNDTSDFLIEDCNITWGGEEGCVVEGLKDALVWKNNIQCST